MKKFIYGIYIVFAIVMGMTFYMANTRFEGLVEPGYYEKSKNFFEVKEAEDALGLTVSVPQTMSEGRNHFTSKIGTASGPLTGSSVVLYIGDVKTVESDAAFMLKETAPGVYETEVSIPYKGKWLMRLEIEHESIRTERRWFITV